MNEFSVQRGEEIFRIGLVMRRNCRVNSLIDLVSRTEGLVFAVSKSRASSRVGNLTYFMISWAKLVSRMTQERY